MKKIKIHLKMYIAAFAIALVVLSGCEKFLAETPKSSIAPQYFYTTIPQCESAITGAMARLYGEWNDQSYGYGWIFFKRDDQMAGGNDNIPADFGKPLWGSHWAAILNCNEVIKAINKGSVIDATPAELDIVLAQAKFVRGWNYFQVVRLWGGVPIYNELNVAALENPLPRASVADVYKQIISDFTFASEKLPKTWANDKRGRPTQGAAYALMAKAYLTMATNPLNATDNYAKAKEAANKVITGGVWDLTPKVEDVFLRENEFSKEMIWSFQSNSADPGTSVQIWNSNEGWGDNSGEATFDSVWPAQPRKTAYLTTVNAAGENYLQWGGSQAPYCHKFVQPNVTQAEWDAYSSQANLPIIRFADVLLIYAEASNMASAGANAPQDACDAINRIIDRANGGAGVINPDPRASRATTAWTKADFDKRVIQERSFELCFEYDRWFDIIRKRLLQDPKVKPPYLGYSYKESDYLWPIPKYDIEQNPLLAPNNPGY